MYTNCIVDWKPEVKYYTHKAGHVRNVRMPGSCTRFKTRPIIHYRKQYPVHNNNNSASKYIGNYLGMYTVPGGNIVTMKSSSKNCVGVSGIANHRLNYSESVACYTNDNCNKIKRGSIRPVSNNFNPNTPKRREAAYWLYTTS